jgi:hypothetical protein
VQPAVLLGYQRAVRATTAATAAPRAAAAVPVAAPPPTVEVIRGDKRVQETLRQE